MPEISVIVPVYNVENKIRRCIDSILAQTFTDFELILVDDGSPDKSGEICEEYAKKDSRIRVIHQENKGVSVARNTGIYEAKGKYISFVDSDDYVDRDYLRIMHEKIDACQLSICGVSFCNENGESTSVQTIYADFLLTIESDSSAIIADLLKDRRFNYIYSKLYYNSIIKQNHLFFREEVSLGEDTVFVLDYLRCIRKIFIIGKPYYNYVRYKGNTLTTSFRRDSFSAFSLVNNYIEKTFSEIGVLNDVLLSIIDKRRFESVGWAVDSIMLNQDLGKKEKVEELSYIVTNTDLQLALIRNESKVGNNPLLKAFTTKSPTKVYNSFIRKSTIGKIVRKIKIMVVHIFPHDFIQKVKKCLRIVH